MRLSLPHCRLPLGGALFLLAAGLNALAEPVVLENQHSWVDGVIDGNIGGDPSASQTILFTTDHTLPRGLSVLQPEAKQKYQGLLFMGATAEVVPQKRTLTLRGPLSVDFGREGGVTRLLR